MSRNFINPANNDEFIKLRGLDLQELIVQVENYFLEYRNVLGLPQDLTFGVEIEYEGLMRIITDRFLKKNLPNWQSVVDSSLSFGGEINSPVMKDKLQYWKELKIICDHLTKRKADTLHNAGGHIHIGTCILGDDIDAWRNFLKLYTIYEHILFRFIYGDKINARKMLYTYALPVADVLYKSLGSINDAKDMDDIKKALTTSDRYLALNFCNVKFYDPNRKYGKNTIEFRSPNATTDAIIWQNNINVFAKMLVSSKQKVMDEDFLDYKLRNDYKKFLTNKYLYDIVNIKDVLELSGDNTVVVVKDKTIANSGMSIGDDEIGEPWEYADSKTLATEKAVAKKADSVITRWAAF